MSWQILLPISIILYSLSVLLQRVLLKDEKTEPISFAILFQSGVAVVTLILVLIINKQIIFPNMLEIWWSLLVMTICYALANIFIFKSLKVTEASRFTVIFSSKTLFAVLGLSLFLSETLSSVQWLGFLFITLGVVVVSIENTSLKFNQGDKYAFFAALMFGLANTNDRYLIKFFDPYTYVVVGFILPAMMIALINPTKVNIVKSYFKKSFIYKMILLCSIYGVAAATFFAALQKASNSSLVFSINSFSGVLIVILSIIFLKERKFIPRKIFGAVLSLVGLLLLNQ